MTTHEGQRRHCTLLASASYVIRTEGFAGLWRGVWPTVLRQGIANGARFAIYERVVAELRIQSRRRGGDDTSTFVAPLAGAITGVASVLLTNPLDVVKTRVQSMFSANASGAQNITMRTLVAREGASVLAHGLAPRAIKIGLGQAVIFGMYDFLVRKM
mmetsp:Transcript_5982/g.19755  ORF Transcript_5982/g.19755 Transcript_5982/m.19755 type:complete len:158 (-) Transcript_5982:225-698(-)